MTELPQLIAVVADSRVCRILQGIVGLYETVLPRRIVGYYLQGSHADHTAVDASDIDLTIVLADDLSEPEADVFWQVARTAILLSPIVVDTFAYTLAQLHRRGFWLKTRSVLVYGRDIREEIPDATPVELLRAAMHRPIDAMLRLRGREFVVHPLSAPDAASEFYGYDISHGFRDHHPYRTSLKELAFLIASIGGALVMHRGGRYVESKLDAARAYRDEIGDEFTRLLDGAVVIRNDWGYVAPVGATARAQLRELCRSVPEFENHFLGRYRRYMIDELREPRNSKSRALALRAGQTIFPDSEYLDALAPWLVSDDDAVRAAAETSARRIREAIERRMIGGHD